MTGLEVVARYTNGSLRRGHTWDFRPERAWFQLQEPDSGQAPIRVMLEDLKAVFFVKSLDGDSLHIEGMDFGKESRAGTRSWVEFKDGEGLAGWVEGLDTHLNGFFIVPVDGASNNEKVFVVWGAVARVLHDEEAVNAARGHKDGPASRSSSVRRISAAAWKHFLGDDRQEGIDVPGAAPERKPARPDSGIFLQDL